MGDIGGRGLDLGVDWRRGLRRDEVSVGDDWLLDEARVLLGPLSEVVLKDIASSSWRNVSLRDVHRSSSEILEIILKENSSEFFLLDIEREPVLSSSLSSEILKVESGFSEEISLSELILIVSLDLDLVIVVASEEEIASPFRGCSLVVSNLSLLHILTNGQDKVRIHLSDHIHIFGELSFKSLNFQVSVDNRSRVDNIRLMELLRLGVGFMVGADWDRSLNIGEVSRLVSELMGNEHLSVLFAFKEKREPVLARSAVLEIDKVEISLSEKVSLSKIFIKSLQLDLGVILAVEREMVIPNRVGSLVIGNISFVDNFTDSSDNIRVHLAHHVSVLEEDSLKGLESEDSVDWRAWLNLLLGEEILGVKLWKIILLNNSSVVTSHVGVDRLVVDKSRLDLAETSLLGHSSVGGVGSLLLGGGLESGGGSDGSVGRSLGLLSLGLSLGHSLAGRSGALDGGGGSSWADLTNGSLGGCVSSRC